jgi:hypothetical protein
MKSWGEKLMFSAEQHESFNTVGFVRLEGAVPSSDVREMYGRIWSLLGEKGFTEDDPSTWTSGSVGALHELKKGEITPNDSAVVRAALDVVFRGSPREQPNSWGQTLVTFPHQDEPWLLPNNNWHFDHPYSDPGEISGVNVFLLIDDVEPEGGSTVVVQSSPSLVDRMIASAPNVEKISNLNKAFLQSHPWLKGLKTARKFRNVERNQLYMAQDEDIDGIATRVVELTGKAGDVFLCHPALCHAAAPNVAARPRLMRTQRVRRIRNVARATSQEEE